ncbi:MAG: hypothetical protein ACR2LT_02130, partial [Pyrinomonadaceae bacterium]
MNNPTATRRIKFVVAAFWAIAAVSFFGSAIVRSSRLTADEYNKRIAQTYDFRFGADKPFAPSNATTYDGKFIAGDDFISSARCATCHTDIHPQWRQS